MACPARAAQPGSLRSGVTIALPVLLRSPAPGSDGRAGLSDWEACARAASRACPVREVPQIFRTGIQ